jgi:hypothetical protein
MIEHSPVRRLSSWTGAMTMLLCSTIRSVGLCSYHSRNCGDAQDLWRCSTAHKRQFWEADRQLWVDRRPLGQSEPSP